jgi:hypothetical protein
MGGRHEVYIVASYFLKMAHHLRQLFCRDLLTFIELAKVVILAVCALHIAMRKEYRAGTFFP